MIIQQGSINTTALIVPDLYVQIVPPQVTLLNGVPTNVLGVVGTATWGPVSAPTVVGSMADFARLFGAIQARKFDMGTAVAAAVLQGANNFNCVRVTDGTDIASTVVVLTNCITFTSKYTGSSGNLITVAVAPGTAASTFKATVQFPGYTPEIFDNIPGSGNTLWVNMAAAINLGQSGIRGPSNYIVATAGVGATAPSTTTYNLASGTDGATTITSAVLIGVDTTPRKGMYALRGTNTSIAVLADADDSTQWSLQVAYGLSEGTYMIMTGPAGDTISNAVTAKGTAGIDSYAAKLMFGDWIYFNDTVNGQTRLIAPSGFVAGRLANLSPEQSSLNKPLYGIVGTQKSFNNLTYSNAELALLVAAGIDLIANPAPAGNIFAVRVGHNSSSNAVINGDNYTRMTNYIAATINKGMGIFIGQLQSQTSRRNAKATLDQFFTGLWDQRLIGNADGSIPFSVVLDSTNNIPSRVALGYMQADVLVTYLSVIEKFLINVQGGQSVVISRTSTQPNQ